jgi:hypothetical protein
MEGGSEANARNQLKRPPHFHIYTLNSLIQGTVKSKPVGIPVIPVCLQERATFEVEDVKPELTGSQKHIVDGELFV